MNERTPYQWCLGCGGLLSGQDVEDIPACGCPVVYATFSSPTEECWPAMRIRALCAQLSALMSTGSVN